LRERKEPEEEETTVDVGLEVENTIPFYTVIVTNFDIWSRKVLW
jgi:hypothetical protein